MDMILNILKAPFSVFGGSTAAACAAIGSTALGLVGVWKIVNFLYDRFIKKIELDVIGYLSQKLQDMGLRVGRFMAWKIKDRKFLIKLVKDIILGFDTLKDSFIDGLKLGSGLKDEKELEDVG
jgi:hypothetical protein